MSSSPKAAFIQETILNPFQLKQCTDYYRNYSYYSKRHSVIISTNFREKRPENQGLYEYVLTTGEWKFLANYEDAFNAFDEYDQHFQFLDESNHLLYAFRHRQYETDALILKYDLQTQKQKLCSLTLDMMNEVEYFSMIFVPEQNELHLFFDNDNHIIVDVKQMKKIYNKTIASNDTFYSLVANLLYVESNKNMFHVGSYEWNKVSSLNCDERKTNEWKHVCNLPFAYDEPIYNTILFDDIIVLFQYFDGHIWCTDVKDYENVFKSDLKTTKNIIDNAKTWHKSMVEIPIQFIWFFNPIAVKDNKNFVHLIRLNNDKAIHFKAEIKNLIPNEIKRRREIIYEPLVIGYLRNEFEDQNMINEFIPHSLKQLIFLYYIFH